MSLSRIKDRFTKCEAGVDTGESIRYVLDSKEEIMRKDEGLMRLESMVPMASTRVEYTLRKRQFEGM